MMKKVKNWNYKDLVEYTNRRLIDGNCYVTIAESCLSFIGELLKKQGKEEEYWQKNKHLVFNLEKYPDLAFDIKTGAYELGEVLGNE